VLENHSNALKSEMLEEANAASERLRKCKEDHFHQLESVKDEFAAKTAALDEEHRKNLEQMRRQHRQAFLQPSFAEFPNSRMQRANCSSGGNISQISSNN
jgi:hypothetical protein